MTEPISDALFGVDGTELPPLSPDPSGRSSWPDASVLPSQPLPHMPNLTMTPEQIAAELGDDPGGPENQDPAATSTANAPSSTTPPAVPPASFPPANGTPPPPAPQTEKPQSTDPPRPTIAAAVSPAQPPRSGSRFASTLANGSFPRVHLRDPRRRFGRLGNGLPSQSRSNGGAGAFFVIMLITFAVLLYFIITGIVDSFARLIP
jgi:hypothetical protein